MKIYIVIAVESNIYCSAHLNRESAEKLISQFPGFYRILEETAIED